MMKFLLRPFLVAFLLLQVAFAQSPVLLPEEFAGWLKSGETETSKDASVADPAHGDLLREYGFSHFEAASYQREGRTIRVRAARFQDATGAYGAFTFYKLPDMQIESVGTQGASYSPRNQLLFYSGDVLVDVHLDRITAMTASEMRSLADALPKAQGPRANLPTLPQYLPTSRRERGVGNWYITNTAKFVVGPVGASKINSPIPASLLRFDAGAEMALGRYRTDVGETTLLLIAYPTPQLAAERYTALQEAMGGEGFYVKRTGPMVVAVSGDANAAEARSLLAAVNYDANVTWNEPTYTGPRDNIGNLIINIFVLIGILLAFALTLGLAFGGLRLLAKRFFPDRVFDRSQDVEIIRLDLAERRDRQVKL